MRRMILGRTGLDVYRLGFGGIPIQRVSEAEAVETVRHALERGVDFIDTSRAYTTSERRIGLALKQAGVGAGRPGGGDGAGGGGVAGRRVVLASKSHAKTADAMRAHLETSLKELQMDYIDIYKAHFVSQPRRLPDGHLPRRRAGGSAQGQGRGPHRPHRDHQSQPGRAGPLPRRRPLRRDHGLLQLSRAPGPGDDHSQSAREEHRRSRHEALLRRGDRRRPAGPQVRPRRARGAGPRRGGAVPICSTRTGGCSRRAPPSPRRSRQQIAELQQSYDKVFCRRCDYCQPCSEDIPIQTVLGVRALVKRMGKETLQKGPLWPAIERGRNCTECGDVPDPLSLRAAHPGPHPGEPALAGRAGLRATARAPRRRRPILPQGAGAAWWA